MVGDWRNYIVGVKEVIKSKRERIHARGEEEKRWRMKGRQD